jgi:hypothetical protein
MNKTHDKTPELLGVTKRVRAIATIVYQGTEYRGRQRERVEYGKAGAYDIVETPGEEFECDQAFAKEAVMSGKAVLVSGGQVDVIILQGDAEFPLYQSWIRNPADPEPVFERCVLLKPTWFGTDCLLEKGSKCRLDISTTPRTSICYEDDQQNDSHTIRISKLSPKKVRISQAETAGKVNAIFAKMFPATT